MHLIIMSASIVFPLFVLTWYDPCTPSGSSAKFSTFSPGNIFVVKNSITITILDCTNIASKMLRKVTRRKQGEHYINQELAAHGYAMLVTSFSQPRLMRKGGPYSSLASDLPADSALIIAEFVVGADETEISEKIYALA